MRGALWVIDAPCSSTESIQESTIGPIDCNLATASLQFPGFGVFQGISLLFPTLVYKERTVRSRAELRNTPAAQHLI